ncbi:hypothetical protein BU17DRAFT_84904 [Hysterangium stoloniferum]|nr:hypothetical protein BU17DRAFT_84904 [Hysterangium stoloniferum]
MSGFTVVPHPTNTPGMLTVAKPIRQQPRGQRSQSPRLPPRGRFHRPTQDLTSVGVPAQPQQQQQQPVSPRHSNPPAAPVAPSILGAAMVVADQESPAVIPTPQAPTAPPLAIAAHPTGRTRRSRHKSTPTATIQDHSADNTVMNILPREPSPTPVKPLMASAPIPVPERRRAQTPPHRQPMSRSDPALSKLTIQTSLPPRSTRKEKRRRNKVKRVAADGAALPLAEWDFPAPGDSEEEEDEDPVTPIKQTGSNDRAWVNAFNDGPKTAPLQRSATQGQFPFFTFPQRPVAPRARTPALGSTHVLPVTPPRQIRPDHRRAPSQPASLSRATGVEGIFHFSEDEADSSPKGQFQKKMAKLFGETGHSSAPATLGTGTPSPPRKKGTHRESVDMSRQLFASSSFQIAPEPVDLPTPSFFLRLNSK